MVQMQNTLTNESEQALNVSAGTLLSTGTSFYPIEEGLRVCAKKKDISENRAFKEFDMRNHIMMSDQNSSDLAPQRQMVSAENNTSGPVPQCSNDVS
ncbi:hypothetical protein Tco_0126879 [Tanacetum coccineum]